MAGRIERILFEFRDVLSHTERLPPDELRTYQESLLVPLLQHARSNVPFYRDRLAPLFAGDEVDLERWNDVPTFTRAQAQRNTDTLTAAKLPPHAGPAEADETTGSTGRPLRFLRNELATMATLGVTDRAFRWWDFDGAKTMATIVGRNKTIGRPPDGTTKTGWRVGCFGLHHMIDMSADTDARIEWFRARHPHYLTGYSIALLDLASRVRARGIDLRFEGITSTGTMLSEEIRALCEQALGARPVDQYGASEIGLIACECPWCGHYHFNAETTLVEILHDDGTPCSPGQTGRVVLTSFYNYAMPFIRYEIGDLAIAGPADSECPIKLPALTRIMGRYRNSFTLRDGRVIIPYVPFARFRRFLSFEQIQVVQTDYDQIEVRYVPLDSSRQADEDGLERCLRETIDGSFKVRAVAVEQIPRSASGKFEDYLSLVPRGND
jgi:phenylacetate-CoA ligase